MHIKLTMRILVCLLGLVWSLETSAEVVVITNPNNPVQVMTPREVSDLYLGRVRSINTTAQNMMLSVLVYEQPDDSDMREKFFRSLNGMSINQVDAYWARLHFSGEVLPPTIRANSRAVLEAVRRNRNAIGYIDSSIADDSVKILLRLKE